VATDAAYPPAGDRGLGPLIEFASHVLVPAGTVTAVVYYFGYVREHALFAYFGVDLGSVQFSTADYLVRGAGPLFSPLVTALVLGVAAVLAHHLLFPLLAHADRQWQRAAWVAFGVAALTLITVGATGVHRRVDALGGPLLSPVSLGAGALLLDYAVQTARTYETLPDHVLAVVDATRGLRGGLLVALALVAAFWATANVAEQHGINAARAIERSLPVRPQAIVYSRDRLQITGPGVSVVRLSGADAAFAFRYNGLRTLTHTDDHWFLLPVGWTHDNGTTVILLPDSTDEIRVDLAP
jgi:hypothetical protein